MLFHVKHTPAISSHRGYEWLDILAIQPVAITARDADELGPWAEKQITCWFYARCPDGFTTISSGDLMIADTLQSAIELGCQYYMAEKDGAE